MRSEFVRSIGQAVPPPPGGNTEVEKLELARRVRVEADRDGHAGLPCETQQIALEILAVGIAVDLHDLEIGPRR